jgi:hypothetical protein
MAPPAAAAPISTDVDIPKQTDDDGPGFHIPKSPPRILAGKELREFEFEC